MKNPYYAIIFFTVVVMFTSHFDGELTITSLAQSLTIIVLCAIIIRSI